MSPYSNELINRITILSRASSDNALWRAHPLAQKLAVWLIKLQIKLSRTVRAAIMHD